MKTCSIDIETYSSVDLGACGLHKYVESPDFEILLIGYSVNGGPVKVLDLTEPFEEIEEIAELLQDPAVLKTAFNAAFERNCLAKWLGVPMPPEQWSDTMIMALECGLPGSLAAAGMALGLPEDQLKDPIGKSLIQYFSKPCKPTKANGGRTRNLPDHDREKWKLYIEYNRQDVVTEMAIRDKLLPLAESEQKLWEFDQRMNDSGVRIDVPMVEKIVEYDTQRREELQREAREITGLSNPNSLSQLKDWLQANGIPMTQVTKETIAAALTLKYLPDDARRVLEIRQALGKTSTAKYSTMLGAVCSDSRLRGILQFYGANRSGRWAGRLVQIQNLARNSLPDLDLARQLTAQGDFDSLDTLFGETSFVFSELVRTAFIPSEGCRFVVSDFSAIEARVIAWLAGEEWVLDAFRAGKDIYCETASMMYHVPVVKHGVNGELRQKGKIATLACIAEGQPVLTDQGLVPIEQVTTDMKIWDGVEWVNHDGVIYKGEKEVIRYGGLEATTDHIVWAEVDGTYRQLRLGDAAACGAHLVQSGAGREAVRLAEDNIAGETIHEGLERVLRADGMHRMRTEILDTAREHDAGKDKRLPELQPAQSGAAMAGQTLHSCEATVREPERSGVQELRRERNPLRVSECGGRLSVHDRELRAPGQGTEAGDRPDRQRRKLCSGKSALGNAERTTAQPKASKKVYDILNAGPRHRFTVSGVLVHNCGYQGGVGAMKAMDSSGSIPEEEMQSIVDHWREANPMIVKLWRDYEAAAKTAIKERRTVRRGIRLPADNLQEREHVAGGPVRPYSVRSGISVEFYYKNGNLLVRLPSGRRLCYWHARVEELPNGREQITYMGVNQTTKQWGKTETYGGKIVENIVQATARDCLAESMLLVDAMGYRIRMHIHDEMIVDVPAEEAEKALADIGSAMGAPISWAPGLPLRGDGYICDYYRKD